MHGVRDRNRVDPEDAIEKLLFRLDRRRDLRPAPEDITLLVRVEGEVVRDLRPVELQHGNVAGEMPLIEAAERTVGAAHYLRPLLPQGKQQANILQPSAGKDEGPGSDRDLLSVCVSSETFDTFAGSIERDIGDDRVDETNAIGGLEPLPVNRPESGKTAPPLQGIRVDPAVRNTDRFQGRLACIAAEECQRLRIVAAKFLVGNRPAGKRHMIPCLEIKIVEGDAPAAPERRRTADAWPRHGHGGSVMAVGEFDIAGTRDIRRSARAHLDEGDREAQFLQLEGQRQTDRACTHDADIRRSRLRMS